MMGHILQVVLTFLTPWSYLKGENSPGTIFLFWLLTLVCEIIPFRSLFIRMDTFVSFYLCSVTNKWMEANWVYMNQRYLTSQNYFTGSQCGQQIFHHIYDLLCSIGFGVHFVLLLWYVCSQHIRPIWLPQSCWWKATSSSRKWKTEKWRCTPDLCSMFPSFQLRSIQKFVVQ